MLNNKKILIIGGTGSWGQELTQQIFKAYTPKDITIYSRGEHKQVVMQRKFNQKNLKFIIGDIRDEQALELAMKEKDVVFHLAALKHVPVCERNPEETIKTNIFGTMNAVDCAIKTNIEKFVLVSTDKAVDPINTYGVSKSMAEKIVIGGNLKSEKTKFVCIRAGNVLGTNGSVVPLFKEQLLQNNKITITDKNMTRYIMRLQDAIRLIFKAVDASKGGEIFVTKMPSFKLMDLAQVMIKQFGNEKTEIVTIGIRPGEKLHEVLVSRYEAMRAMEYGDYYVTLPTISMNDLNNTWKGPYLTKEYNSDENQTLSQEELKKLLKEEGWFDNKEQQELKEYSKEELMEFFKREKWTQ